MTLEKLLNILCEKGRVPFGDEKIYSFEIIYVTGKIRNIVAKRGRGQVNKHYSIREICSIESGLWQFCVDNRLVRKDRFTWMISPDPLGEDQYNYTDYRHRIIESALCDEDKLGQFLLDNIQIGK